MTRVLPAKVYDALAMSAAMYGGIGAGRWCLSHPSYRPYSNPEQRDGLVPVCYIGHGWMAGFIDRITDDDAEGRAHYGITWSSSDTAVWNINTRKGKSDTQARVTFEEWCAQLGVVRGEEPAVASPAEQSCAGDAGEVPCEVSA